MSSIRNQLISDRRYSSQTGMVQAWVSQKLLNVTF
jgi:hypothetical protein